MPRRNKRSQMHNPGDSFALATMDIMIGDACPCGPGGRNCPCCGDAPGKDRVAARRMNKRRKRQEFTRSIRGYYRSPRSTTTSTSTPGDTLSPPTQEKEKNHWLQGSRDLTQPNAHTLLTHLTSIHKAPTGRYCSRSAYPVGAYFLINHSLV